MTPAVVQHRAPAGQYACGDAQRRLQEAVAARLPSWDERKALALRLGFSPRVMRCAAAGRRITAEHHLRICAAIGCDPYSGKSVPVVKHPGPLDRTLLAIGLRIKRADEGLGLRGARPVLDLSVATLSRLENGHPVWIEHVLAVCRFIGVHPFHYLAGGAAEKCFTTNIDCNTLKSQETVV